MSIDLKILQNKRECGDCTACCDGWLAADIYGHSMYPGCPCHFKSNKGCSIYNNRPDGCKNFKCGYLIENSPFPEWFRPKDCGVIIICSEWNNKPFFALLETDRPLNIDVLLWVIDYCTKNKFSFCFSRKSKWRFFGENDFIEEMNKRIKEKGRIF